MHFHVILSPDERATAEALARRKGINSVGGLFRHLIAAERDRVAEADTRMGRHSDRPQTRAGT